MDEIWVRVGVMAGALIAVGAIAAMMRRRATGSVRQIDMTHLGAGTYFFSSTSCATCRTARAKLDEHLGADGYTEFAWEQEPALFRALGIDAVPATLIVDGDLGRLYSGQPERALKRL